MIGGRSPVSPLPTNHDNHYTTRQLYRSMVTGHKTSPSVLRGAPVAARRAQTPACSHRSTYHRPTPPGQTGTTKNIWPPLVCLLGTTYSASTMPVIAARAYTRDGRVSRPRWHGQSVLLNSNLAGNQLHKLLKLMLLMSKRSFAIFGTKQWLLSIDMRTKVVQHVARINLSFRETNWPLLNSAVEPGEFRLSQVLGFPESKLGQMLWHLLLVTSPINVEEQWKYTLSNITWYTRFFRRLLAQYSPLTLY